MRTRSFRRCTVFSLLAALAGVATAAGGESGTTPFKAAFVTRETIAFNPAACPLPPFLQGSTTGDGLASQLGKTALKSTDCVAPVASSFTFTSGALVLTAANGDTLTAEYSGSLLPAFQELGFYSLSGSYRVTGGTGRFVGATGSGYLRGTTNIVTGLGAYTATGTLSRP